jgi:putative lipoprotein
MADEPAVVVRGEVVVPPDAAPAGEADLVVEVEDVSRADAPSQVIGTLRVEGVEVAPGATLPFAVEVPADAVDERRFYSVRAHVDVSRSGTVERGDLLSTRSYPVLTRGHGREATIAVRAI